MSGLNINGISTTRHCIYSITQPSSCIIPITVSGRIASSKNMRCGKVKKQAKKQLSEHSNLMIYGKCKNYSV
jgi:hypothetical protein